MTDLQYTPIMKPRFGALERIDVGTLAAAVTEQWYSETLCQVSDSIVRLGVFCGEYHWHHHDDEDEFFYVVEGRLHIELEGHPTVELGSGQGVTVPQGLEHRPIAPARTIVLVIERASVRPTGDQEAHGHTSR